MPEKLPHIPFYPGDWLRDDVSGCSLAAQGLWLRMMIVAHDAERYGYLQSNGSPMSPDTIARRCGCDPAQYESLLFELTNSGVPSKTTDGIIYSRRMVRDGTLREVRAKAGRKGGKQTAKQKRSKPPAKPQQNHDTDSDSDSDTENSYSEELPPILDNSEFRKAFGVWLAYKKERRESYKPSGLSGVIDAAAARATSNGIGAVIDAMQSARANGWQGWDQKSLFGAKNGNSNTAPRVGAGQRYSGRRS